MKVGDYIQKLEMDNSLDGNMRDLLYTQAMQRVRDHGPSHLIDGCASLFLWGATPQGSMFWSRLHYSEGW
jgi:hypothetical protein